jgi:hypothetical protein
LQDALGALNERAAGKQVLSDITADAGLSKSARVECKRLAKRLAGGTKRDRRRIEKAWKAFKKAKPFWTLCNRRESFHIDTDQGTEITRNAA